MSNPSFEKHKTKANTITNAIPWRNVGTVDYYLKPEKKDTSKFKGARTGTCYAGLRFQPDYKEYMYVPLLETLEKDRTYRFKMYVRLLGQSTVTVKQLGVYFSDEVFKIGMVFDEEGLVDSIYKKGLSGQGWLPIQGDYQAKGNEKYIIIGNFRTKMKEDMVKRNKWDLFELREAYYYVDDISVRKILTAADSANVPKIKEAIAPVFPDSLSTGQVIEIKGFQFENGSAIIKKTSYKILDQLVRDLNDHPFAEIQINGHTDDHGTEAANRKLSKDRAKAVYNYLLAQGVVNPMTYKGFGSSQPVAPNDTDDNKAKNRRVELLIIKQE